MREDFPQKRYETVSLHSSQKSKNNAFCTFVYFQWVMESVTCLILINMIKIYHNAIFFAYRRAYEHSHGSGIIDRAQGFQTLL